MCEAAGNGRDAVGVVVPVVQAGNQRTAQNCFAAGSVDARKVFQNRSKRHSRIFLMPDGVGFLEIIEEKIRIRQQCGNFCPCRKTAGVEAGVELFAFRRRQQRRRKSRLKERLAAGNGYSAAGAGLNFRGFTGIFPALPCM